MKGLINLGSTCYFNSALQCLLQTPILANTFLKTDYTGNCQIVYEYQNVVRNFWKNDDPRPLDVSKLLNLFREKFKQFEPGYQHDAQEAVLCLVDALDTKFTTFEMIQETVCKSEKTRIFPTMTMYTGVLDGSERWCGIENFEDSKGETHALAATRTLFWKLPKVLILSLTVKTVVTLEEDLDLSKWLHPESIETKTTYKLFATCVHSGSQNGGHYAAFTRHKGQWYLKDDDAVSKVDSYPKTCGHHIMFFK